jgi:hypothetical protein
MFGVSSIPESVVTAFHVEKIAHLEELPAASGGRGGCVQAPVPLRARITRVPDVSFYEQT